MTLRTFVRRVLGGGPPAPVLTSAQRAEQQAGRAMQQAEREWARRMARIAEERRAESAAREAAEEAARAAARERAALRREAILDHVARYGFWFPGDYTTPRELPRGWFARLWDVFRYGS